MLAAVESIRPVQAVLDDVKLLFTDGYTLYVRIDSYNIEKIEFPINSSWPVPTSAATIIETGSAETIYVETGDADHQFIEIGSL
jgi:hypothetical protein